MAVTVTKAAQIADGARKYPIDDHGKIRIMYGKITQVGAGDATSSWIIGSLPPGRVRVLPHLSRYKVSALGASRVMDIGHDAYTHLTEPADSAQTAAAPAAFADDIDVSGATHATFPTTGGFKHDMYSRDGIQLRATVAGGTIPDGATGEFLIAYVCE